MESQLGEVLECPVCMDTYTDPRSLPCGHAFCLQCLRPLLYHGTVRCPTCRGETSVSNVADLPKPYALLEVLRLLEGPSISENSGANTLAAARSPQPEHQVSRWKSVVQFSSISCSSTD